MHKRIRNLSIRFKRSIRDREGKNAMEKLHIFQVVTFTRGNNGSTTEIRPQEETRMIYCSKKFLPGIAQIE